MQNTVVKFVLLFCFLADFFVDTLKFAILLEVLHLVGETDSSCVHWFFKLAFFLVAYGLFLVFSVTVFIYFGKLNVESFYLAKKLVFVHKSLHLWVIVCLKSILLLSLILVKVSCRLIEFPLPKHACYSTRLMTKASSYEAG